MTRLAKSLTIIAAFVGLISSPGRAADAPPMTVGGQFEVSPTGAASYSIPIIVPPGTAGLAPSLSLNYSSQSGNGIVGFGWSLGGLPSITRCPQTYAQDGVHGSVNYDSNDRYCLDGQRLLKVGGSGGYGAANSEYRTEVETFSKIIAHNADDSTRWFEVHTKSGQILELGNTSDSRIIPVAVPPLPAFTLARAWLVNKVSDTVGNYFKVTYVNDTTTTNGPQYYPDHIVYTLNDTAGLGAYNSVWFKYGTPDRGDITPLYHAGSVMKTTKLLSDIKTYTNTTGTGPAVTDYKLAYQLGNAAYSQLTSVQRCDGSGACLPATSFTWQTATTWSSRIVIDSTPGIADLGYFGAFLSADFNGDGVQDGIGVHSSGTSYACYNPAYDMPLDFGSSAGLVGANTTSVLSGTTYLACLSGSVPYTGGAGAVGDYEGDGLTDMTAGYFGQLQNDGLANFSQVSGGFGLPPSGNQAIDFDDDGLSDGGATYDSSTGILNIGLANSSHGSTAYSFTIGASADLQVGTGLGGDFDGDGCADMVFQRAVPEVFLTCPSLAANSPVAISIPNYYINSTTFSDIYFGDFNGDGNSDYFTVPYPTGTGAVNISTGASFLSPTTVSGFQYGASENRYLIGDFDGDGKSDVILVTPTNFSVYTWNGTTLSVALTVYDVLPQPNCGIPTGCTDPRWNGTLQTADVDGDGCTDLVVYQGTHSPNSYYYKFGCHPPLLMTEISNGIGATTTISYDRLNKNDFYTKCTNQPGVYRCTGTTYPTQAIDGPIYVVTQVDTSDGLGVCTPVVGNSAPNCFTSKYAYAGAKKDLLGRGFLGFEQVAVTDLQTNVTTTTSYNTLFPYTGTVTEEKRTLGSTVLSDTINSYGTVPAMPVTGTPTFVYLKDTTISANEVDNTPLPGSTTTHLKPDGSPGYDAFGSPTYIQTNITDLSSKTTTNTYSNDSTNWIIGRLTNTTVTSVVVNLLGTSTITRTSSFGYISNGVLDSEIIEPGSGSVCNGNSTSCTLDTEYPSANIDAFGHPLVKQVSGVSFATRTTSVTYDALGQFETSATNAITTPGPQTEYFDYTGTYGKSFGVMTGHTDLNGLVTNWSYDSFGRQTNETQLSINGPQTDTSYELCGGSVVCPANGAFVVTVTPYNHGHTQNGPAKKTFYDALSRVIATDVQGFDGPSSGCTLASPCWIRTETQYDADGYVARTSRPYFLAGGTPKWTTYSYAIGGAGSPDPYGRPSRLTAPDTGLTSYAYTGLGTAGSQTSVTNALTQTTITTKNAQGLVSSVKNALNKTTSYAYDAYGDLLRVTDPLGNHIDNTYDIRGNKTASADPDMGAWSYTYDALGEVLSQTDAKIQTTNLTYDALGRVTSRNEPDQTSIWTYDTATHGVGFLKSATGSNAGYTRTQFYDAQERPSKTKLVINGTTYLYVPTYNPDNRLDTLTYPSGLVVQYVYTAIGYLQQLKDKTTGAVLWTANARDAELHLTDQSAGNHTRAIAVYDPNTGLVQQIRAGASEADDSSVAHYDYAFDQIGNLKSRSDSYESYAENFCYDGLNRLTAYSVGGVSTTDCHSGTTGLVKTAAYNDIGNITNKSDLASGGSGNFTYPASGGSPGSHPHAVSSILGTVNGVLNPSYKYDANGNMICEYSGLNCTGAGIVRDSETYWASNMAKTLTQGTTTVSFVYDSEHARVTQAVANGSSTVTTTYLNDPATGAMSEMVASGGTPTWNDYLMADGKLLGERNCIGAATSTSPCTGTTTTEYFVLDHLQSVSVVTDGTTGSSTYGQVTARESFDAWGRQRNANGTDDTICGLGSSSPNKRRFTSQEHIDEMCLINLNARVYDPAIGRFMTADSIVPHPYDAQSYNRYTYVDNRPLSFTDPSGHDQGFGAGCEVGSACNPEVAPGTGQKQGGASMDPSPKAAGWGQRWWINTLQQAGAKNISVTRNSDGSLALNFTCSGGDSKCASKGREINAEYGGTENFVGGEETEANDYCQAVPLPMPISPPVAGQMGGPTPDERKLAREIEDWISDNLDPRPLAKEIGSIVNAVTAPGAYDYRDRALTAAGINPASARANDYEVHHIVAATAPRAQLARDALSGANIGIHDLQNLVVMRVSAHQNLHTNLYYDSVNFSTTTGLQVAGRPGVSAALATIRTSLVAKGRFP